MSDAAVAAMTVTGKTTLCLLLGYPVTHSASPRMHNAAFAALGLDWVYVPWGVRPEAVQRALEALGAIENFGGANVTIPHKEAAFAALDELSPEAAAIGAVNTIVPRAGTLVGHNTDGTGFLAALWEEADQDPRGRRVGVVGTGGGAKAVAYALSQAEVAQLTIFSRQESRARAVVSHLRRFFQDIDILALGLQHLNRELFREMDIFINATPVGMQATDPPLFDYKALSEEILVVDLIYRPAETPLLAAARARGCRTLNGAGMLLYQGVQALELWTGRKAPVSVMREALAQDLYSVSTAPGIGLD